MLLEELAVEEGNVALDIYWEILHLGNKLGSGGCMDGAVDLKVQEVGAREGMVFIPKGLFVAESA